MNLIHYLIVLSEMFVKLSTFVVLVFYNWQSTPKKNAELREDIYRKFTII